MVQMDQNGEELEPVRSEVEWAINQLPLGKSAGNDAIHGEMIKASGEEGISIYHIISAQKYGKKRNGLQNGPRQFLSPYLKKATYSDLQQCTNYRTIALISHARKILLKIIMKRLQRKLDEEINQTQAGFRQNRGIRDQIFMSRSQYKLAYVFYRLLKSLRLRWTSRNDRSIEEDELPLQDHKLNN